MSEEILKQTSARLLDVITTAKEKFSAIGEEQWTSRRAPGKWSRKEVLGHLVDSAANNHQRFVRAQLVEDTYKGPGYEQDEFVAIQHFQSVSTQELTELWFYYNSLLAHVIATADPSKLNVTCYIGKYDPVPLSFVMTDYVDHMVHHLMQITL